ncbi:carbamoyltransferase HypF [Methanolapillus ohkumae]|uniref:acylphosphatase n=1 Tax=Methanolapillus ohkumae TaxID=3028298 RepID=A0AA96V5M8_9EURY|nr:Carbamoyltransferase HypF [Methanosarcinaceae archaeon Am2]
MTRTDFIAKKIRIKGVVQGVGFRPFVYRIALSYGIFGHVINLGNLVEIAAAGNAFDFESFVTDLITLNPPLSRIDGLEISDIVPESEEFEILFQKFKNSSLPSSSVSCPLNSSHPTHSTNSSHPTSVCLAVSNEFFILESQIGADSGASGAGNSIIPPDTAICSDCLSEIHDKSNRRYMYPFTVCTNCGPRYTTVRGLPYDRKNTSMDDFPLCDFCLAEYTNVADRRYHAQPVCCPDCGPRHSFQKSSGSKNPVNPLPPQSFGNDALKDAAKAIDNGFIVALKGYGGFHLVCDAFSEDAVSALRCRLNRPSQPFAVMVRNEATAQKIASLKSGGADALALLQNIRRPIVVLDKSDSYPLAPSVAPRLHNIGIMLAYSGTHHVLFESLKTDCIVMTSANLPGLPMVIDNDEAVLELSHVCDYFLFHNRTIENRTDDTVIRFVNQNPIFLRRSRGFVPERIRLPFSSGIETAAVGAEMNNSISFAKDGNLYLSQYIGNTKHLKTAKYHAEAYETLRRLTGISPQKIACDLHPGFNTTKFAEEIAEEIVQKSESVQKYESIPKSEFDIDSLVRIQHHHAHICSVMADNMLPLESEILGIAIDGVGYGDDQTVWGGEILRCGYVSYTRLASLLPQPMPGGDLASYYPSRMVFGMLFPYVRQGLISKEELFALDLYFKHGDAEKKAVLSQLENNFNLFLSTGSGRVLDAISTLLGLCRERTYDGEPSMILESAAACGLLESPDLTRFVPEFKTVDGKDVFDTSALLYAVYREMTAPPSAQTLSFSVNELAAMAVHSFSVGIARLALDASQKTGISTVGISGGVANNDYIVSVISSTLKERGIHVLTHKNLPPGDGCISHGQTASMTARLLMLEKEKNE